MTTAEARTVLASMERDILLADMAADIAADRERERFKGLEEIAERMQERTRRTRSGTFEVRTAADGSPKIVGHAAVFESRSDDLGGWVEVLSKGAFRDAIPASDIRALFNHDSNYVLGRTKAGTLKVTEDRRGLRVDIRAPDNDTIRHLVLDPMRRGDVTGMSFSFRLKEPAEDHIEWSSLPGDLLLRRVLPGGVGELFDIGPVTFPAYSETTAGVRELQRRGLTLDPNPRRRTDQQKRRRPLTPAERDRRLATMRRELGLDAPQRTSVHGRAPFAAVMW